MFSQFFTLGNISTIHWISGIIVVAILIIFWLIHCFCLTKSGTITVLGIWGADAFDFKGPGLSFFCWPYIKIMDVIPIQRKTFDIEPPIMNCRTDANGQNGSTTSNEQIDYTKTGVIEVKPSEISIVYKPGFDINVLHKDAMLEGFYEISTNGKLDHDVIKGILKDIVQRELKAEIEKMTVSQVLSMQHGIITTIKAKIDTELKERGLPIDITDLSLNQRIELANPADAEALRAKATARLQLAAVEDEQAVEIEKAKLQIVVTRHEAEALAAKMEVLAKAYGFNELPPASVAKAWLTADTIKAYKAIGESSSAKVVMLPNIGSLLPQVETMLSELSKKGGG